jgi:hypothetical protein
MPVGEPQAFLEREDVTLLRHQSIDHGDHLAHGQAQTAKFAHDQRIPWLQCAEEAP